MKKIVYNFYIFYIATDNILHFQFGDIFGYTDDIECVENFISTRNMNLFHVKKVELSRNEINLLHKNHMKSIIRMRDIITYDDKVSKIITVNIALTDIEYIMYNNAAHLYTDINIHTNVFCNPFIFKDQYKSALSKIMYIYAFLYVHAPDAINDNHKIYPNGLSIIMDIIGDTLIKNKKIRESI